MMTQTTVIDAMRDAFENASGDIAARMLAAFKAAQLEDDEHWLDLIKRIQENGMIQRAGAGDELLQAIERLG